MIADLWIGKLGCTFCEHFCSSIMHCLNLAIACRAIYVWLWWIDMANTSFKFTYFMPHNVGKCSQHWTMLTTYKNAHDTHWTTLKTPAIYKNARKTWKCSQHRTALKTCENAHNTVRCSKHTKCSQHWKMLITCTGQCSQPQWRECSQHCKIAHKLTL